MADAPVELYHDRRRIKRKRVAAGFFVSVVAIAQHFYCRRKIVEFGDFSEDEADIRHRKQMLSGTKANKYAASYRHKVIKFWDKISLVYSKNHANGVGARTASKCAKEMAVEHGNNNKNNDDASSTQAEEDRNRKKYRSDDSIAFILGEKLDNFTSAYKVDACESPSKPAPPEEILAALEAIPGLEEDELLVAYDILVSNDRKFKSLLALPNRIKKKWVLKQVNS